MKKSILYSSTRSPHCLKVAIFLQEKGVPFERTEINLPAKEQRTPEYLAINPLGLVPAYEDGNGIHCDSLVIMQYLEAEYPNPPLFPTDSERLEEALDWIEFSSDQVRDVSHHLYWQVIEPPADGVDNERVAELKQDGMSILHRLENELSQQPYMLGDFSVVDIALLPWIYGYQRFDFPFAEQFPKVLDWLTRLINRPSFQDNYHKQGRPFFDKSS